MSILPKHKKKVLSGQCPDWIHTYGTEFPCIQIVFFPQGTE